MFGSKLSPHEAQRRTKIAIALSDGSLPGAAEALASGQATLAHVAALAEVNDRLPAGAAAELLPRAKELSPDKFRRAVHRAAPPVAEVGDASTGTTSSGGRWFRFRYDGHEGTIVLNGLEAVMDRAWRRDHPDRADEKLDRPPYGQRLAAALLEMARDALAGTTTVPTATTRPTRADTAAETPSGPDSPPPPGPTPSPTRAKAIRAQPEIIVVITYEKMFGDAEAAGICTTIDGVPLPVDVVRKMLVDAKIYPIVLGGDGEVLDFGRSRRFFSTAQRKPPPCATCPANSPTATNPSATPTTTTARPLGRRRPNRHRQRSTHLPAPATTNSPTTATASNDATAPPTPTHPTDNSSTNATTDGNNETPRPAAPRPAVLRHDRRITGSSGCSH